MAEYTESTIVIGDSKKIIQKVFDPIDYSLLLGMMKFFWFGPELVS